MRLWLLLVLAVPATSLAGAMGYDEARHLLSRTGFSATEREIRDYSGLSRAQAVDRLLGAVRREAQTAPPAWVQEPFSPRKLREMRQSASEDEKRALQRELREKSLDLRAWWLQEMLVTGSPLTERMTLFWHNHFVSSQQKVKSPVLMYRQNRLLRRHAFGNFGELLHAVARDPAMILYLDSASNRKGQPNENFAREVMELFTLGEGRYREPDIKEAARAFTGWGLDRETGNYHFYRLLHDDGDKTVLGRRGRFNGDDVLDILLAQPATAEFITTKLWREFVSPQPDPAELKRLAALFRDSRYDIRALLRAMLLSEHFYVPRNRAVLVKSPVDLLVGTLRLFDMQPGDLRPAALSTRSLGQDLFAPPNVKGWPGGEAWINSTTLLNRRQLLARLFRAEEMPVERAPPGGGGGEGRPERMLRRAALDYRFDGKQWFRQFPGDDAAQRSRITRLVLASAPQEMPPAAGLPEYLGMLVLDPVYQLK